MQKYFNVTIAKLLPLINKRVFIPSIQRPYVWELDQIVKLFDSLMRGYPISTFLVWELEPHNFGDWEIYRFVSNFKYGDIHNDLATLAPDQSATLVLDGQQRLTSLLIGLAGTYTVRNGQRGRGAGWISKILLLDLLHAADDVADDAVEDNDGSVAKDLHYGLRFSAADRLPKDDEKAIWFKVSNIVNVIDREQLAVMIGHLELQHPNLSSKSRRLLQSNLTRLWETIHDDQSIAYYLERTQSYDKVLDIFIRANDGGTKLSKSDLLMSMVTLRWERYNARSETEAVTYSMRNSLGQDNAFDRDFLLRSGLFFNDLSFGFQLRNFTPRNIAVIETKWPEIKQALLLAADLFKRLGICGTALTAINAVMLIGCYIFKLNQGREISDWLVPDTDQDLIRRWVTGILFHNVLSGTANITMEFYRRAITEQLQLRTVFPIEHLTARMAVRGRIMSFDAESIERFLGQEHRSRLFELSLRLLSDRTDWLARDWQVVRLVRSERLLDGHLRLQGVRQDRVEEFQKWGDRLANHVVLDDSRAREYMSMPLSEWVASRTPKFLEEHCLPNEAELYSEANFLELIGARRHLIGLRLRRRMRSNDEPPSSPLDGNNPVDATDVFGDVSPAVADQCSTASMTEEV